MWPSVRTQSGVDRILFLITAVSALVFLSTASPTVSAAAAKVHHSRARTAVAKQLPVAVRQPTTAEEPSFGWPSSVAIRLREENR
jgi:hypothetical protein